MKARILLIIAALLSLSPFPLTAQEQQQQPMSEKEMQERLKQMEQEMAKMRQTKNPQERMQMMNQHMEHMRDMMNDMGCCQGSQPMMRQEPKK
jgi:outer membrane lipoprotein-sorting protein